MTKKTVALAIACLEEAVLDVMPKDGSKITAAKISENAGIFRDRGVIGMNDAIVSGIINILHGKGLIKRAPNGRGWQLK